MDRRRLVLLVFLAGAAVYLAVWPHELGHAAAAWLQGCKADGWRTGTRWYLWGSQGGDVDFGCLARRGRGALALTALAGAGGSVRFWTGFFLFYSAGVGLIAAVNRAVLG